MHKRSSWTWIGALLLALAFSCITPHRVHAYAWMIRHDYTGCATCHADPSGAGLLTECARPQGDLLLRMRYARPNTDEPDSSAGFVGGVVTPPEWLLLGGDARGMG